jgi:flagellar FliJ protein
MARFVFKLEGVLKQRRHEERERLREVSVRQAAVTEVQSSLQRLNESVSGSNEEVRQNRLTGVLDMNFLGAHRRFLFAMQRRAIELAQKMAYAHKQLHEAQALLAEAAKRRKTIEKLRENQFARWRAERNRKEQLQLDEAGMQIAFQNITRVEPA